MHAQSFSRQSPSSLRRGVAIITLSLATILTYVPHIPGARATFLYLLAVLVTVKVAGRRVALTAAIVSTLGVAYQLPPSASLYVNPPYLPWLALYVILCLAACIGSANLWTGLKMLWVRLEDAPVFAAPVEAFPASPYQVQLNVVLSGQVVAESEAEAIHHIRRYFEEKAPQLFPEVEEIAFQEATVHPIPPEQTA